MWRFRSRRPAGSTKQVGDWAEEKAAAFLRSRGYRILARNVRLGPLELDLVALDGDTLCFVEVRYRADCRHGHPTETVGPRKQRRLTEAAERYLARHPEQANRPVRFDLVSLWGPGAEHVELLPNILWNE